MLTVIVLNDMQQLENRCKSHLLVGYVACTVVW
jgi:hypothetical protein